MGLKYKISLLALCLMCLNIHIWAQQLQPAPSYVLYRDSVGKLYAPQNLALFFNVSFDANGKQQPQLLKAENGDGMFLSEGENKLCNSTSLSTAKGKKKQTKCYVVFGDGSAPLTDIKFINAPKFSGDSGVFYGKNLSIDIFPNDNLSGVKETFYSLNNTDYIPFNTWQQTFSDGSYKLLVYSEDNVGNLENAQNFDFVVDVSAPSTSAMEWASTGSASNS